MKIHSIYDIAEGRLEWAKHLQRKNEELEAEVKRLCEVIQRVVTILGPDEIEAEELLVDALKERTE